MSEAGTEYRTQAVTTTRGRVSPPERLTMSNVVSINSARGFRFYKLGKAFLARTDLDPYEKLILLVLWDMSSCERVYPSYATIAKRSGLSRKTVEHKLQAMASLGWVEAIQQKGSSNVYKLNDQIIMIMEEDE